MDPIEDAIFGPHVNDALTEMHVRPGTDIRPLLAAVAQALDTAGFVVVPRYPTERMIEAGNLNHPYKKGLWSLLVDEALEEMKDGRD